VRNFDVSAETVVWSGGGPAGPILGLSERVYLPLLRRWVPAAKVPAA